MLALSGVAGICIFILAFLTYYFYSITDSNPDNNPAGGMNMFPDNWFKAGAAVPNIVLALTYHINLFPIFKGMKNVNDKKFSLASITGLSFCVVAYIVVGIFGYDYVGS